ncbi:MAG TPA: hypothetical protein VE570_07320 [Thermoleophilaceae bacterium]|nr:hypothetical protein [Thermoleophilaceae bacterium]
MPTVVLSTGRCGTQWLTETLRELYGDMVRVEHEPLGALYSPRRFFRSYAQPEAVLKMPEVRAHVDAIAACNRPYIETGWPLFAALPLFAARFGAELRVIHLTRHPVPSALSHMVHNSFAGSDREDPYTRLATLGPSDPRVFQPEYADRWDDLTPYEKCLFWVTEVGLFGLEFEALYPEIPFLRVQSERMLAGDRTTLTGLCEHMELGWDERWAERTRTRVDQWHHHTDAEVDPLLIERHPRALATAERLGYRGAEVDLEALRARYSARPSDRSGAASSR